MSLLKFVAIVSIPLAAFAFGQMNSPAKSKPAAPAMGSTIFNWEQLVAQASPKGSVRRVCDTPTATLDRLESHITTLNPGLDSHPPHRHPHEELIILKEGTLEVFLNGEVQRVGPGSILFYASNDLHKVRNVGATPATYIIFTFYTAKTPAPAPATAAGAAKP